MQIGQISHKTDVHEDRIQECPGWSRTRRVRVILRRGTRARSEHESEVTGWLSEKSAPRTKSLDLYKTRKCLQPKRHTCLQPKIQTQPNPKVYFSREERVIPGSSSTSAGGRQSERRWSETRQRMLSPADAGVRTRTWILRPCLGLCYWAQSCNLRTKDRVSQVSSKAPADKGTGQN